MTPSSSSDHAALPDLDARTLEMPPIERAETIPASWYVDERFHAFDREVIFSQHWQYVGPASDLEVPGDYVQVDIAGNPVIIVRDKEETIRGFYNVCRHRGGPLVMDDCGHTNVLQCKYHGRTYLLDGSLRGVPKFDRAELFDRKGYGLIPVHVAIWQGLMFVNLADDPTPLTVVLDGITGCIAPMQLDALHFVRRDTIEVRQRAERDAAFSDRVQQEDIEICEHVQRGLQSKAYDRGRFSVEMEEGVYHFQRLLKRAYRRTASR